MLNIHTLSGFEGVGKSTIINHFQDNVGYAVIPETARLIIPLEETVLKDSRDDLSYKSFISYLTNMHFMLSNNLSMNVISDRNLVDSLTYLKLFSTDQRMDLNDTGDFIEKFLDSFDREHLYDSTTLILHPTDDKYITDSILSDPERLYGKDVQNYKDAANRWEDVYFEIAEKLNQRRLAPKLNIVDSFPKNPEIIVQTEYQITGKFPKVKANSSFSYNK